MNPKNLKLFFTTIALVITCINVDAQVTGSNNTLGSTGITAIQSTTNSNYKLVVGGAVKLFNTGNSGLASPSLYLINTSGAGRKYFINADNAGAFNIMDSAVIAAPRFTINSTGNIGIGVSTPTAYLHLKAGTTAAGTAPLKFSSGTNLTTPEAGVMEFDGTNLYFSPSTVRKTIAYTDLSNITGTLGVTKGGTGLTSLSTGDIPYATAANTLGKLTAGTNGQVLTLAGGVPSWVTGTASQWTTTGSHIYYNTGNVGIGTTTPAYNLDVTGTSRLSADALINSLRVGKGTGSNNSTSTALGTSVLGANTTGHNNTALGYQSMYSNTEGYGNVAIGSQAMYSTTGAGGTGYQNTAVGQQSLFSNTTGYNNTAIGIVAMYSNTTGMYNTAVGSSALRDNTSGIYNTALGLNAMLKNTTGGFNTAVGYTALNENITGTSNTAVGWQALFANTAINNTAVGRDALTYNTTGVNNTAVGTSALYESGTGYNNTALGTIALQKANIGIANTASGVAALQYNTTGNHNSAFGHYSGNDMISGEYNIFLGSNSGRGITTGSYNTILGSQVTGLSNSLSNNIIIADGQGNRRINVNSIGNVGIGTTAPTRVLHVEKQTGGAAVFGSEVSGNYSTWPTTANAVVGIVQTSSGSQLQALDLGNNNFPQAANTSTALTFSFRTSGNANGIGAKIFASTINNTTETSDLTLSATNNILLSPSGNVGVGGTSPSEKLDVTGNIKLSGAFMPAGIAGTSGQVLTSAGAGAPPTWTTLSGAGTSSAWSLTGNAGTNPATNFIGTTDDQPLLFKVNNINAGKLASTGFVSLGYEANNANLSATNTAIGHQALKNITGGADWTTAVGYQAGINTTTGDNNSFIGYTAGRDNVSGRSNTALGKSALLNSVSGNENTSIGSSALETSNGSYMTAIGSNAGRDFATSTNCNSTIDNNCLFLGAYASRDASVAPSTALTNAIAIGYKAKVGASNSLVLGGMGANSVNVGIGTTTPSAFFHVKSQGGTNSGILVEAVNPGSYAAIELKNDVGELSQIGAVGSSYTNGVFSSRSTTLNTNAVGGISLVAYNTAAPILFATGGLAQSNERMRIDANGNVGIGTTTPNSNTKLHVAGNIYSNGIIAIGSSIDWTKITGNTDPALNYKLAVNGNAIFERAKVKLNATWPDYVFKPTYKLPSLHDLETYLIKNNHLPDMPSAEEVEKNGIDLGDNQTILLKKVEELTLYMIELNKKVEALSKENEQLKKKVNGTNQ